MMRYVEVCERARAKETYYVMKQLAFFFVTNATHMVEAPQYPGVPCEARKFSK